MCQKASVDRIITVENGLAGTYRIGANWEFKTINDALNRLHSVGVSGACVFELTDNEYNERSWKEDIKERS